MQPTYRAVLMNDIIREGDDPLKATIWAWGILLGLSLPSLAGAAGTYSAEKIFTDPQSGAVYYNVERIDLETREKRVVVKMADGQWKKWNPNIRSMRVEEGQQLPVLDTNFADSVEGGMQYIYDPEDQEVVKGKLFRSSPDGKWGIHERLYFEPTGKGNTGKVHSYVLRNNQTGKTKEWLRTDYSIGATWLSDNRIIYSRLNEKLNQEEIVIYDPAADKLDRVAFGNLRGVQPDKGYVVYTLNKPDRPLYLLDLKKRVSKPLKDWAAAEAYLPHSENAKDSTIDLPSDFDLDALPEEKMKMKTQCDYKVTIDGTTARVPFVFEEKQTAKIPVKPLAEVYGWKLSKLDKKTAAFRFKLEHGSRSIELNPTNSVLEEGILYMTTEQIKQLGYRSVNVAYDPEP